MIVSVESDPVVRLEVVTTSSTTIELRWSPPVSSNARIQFYVYSYRELEALACMMGPGSWSPVIDIRADRHRLELPDLLSYCKYEVMLSAYTVAGQGRAAVVVATTDAAGKHSGWLSDKFLLLSNTFYNSPPDNVSEGIMFLRCPIVPFVRSSICPVRLSGLAKLTYCSPAWSGYCTAADVGRLDSFLRRCRRLGYCEQSQPSIAELYSDIDDTFFSRIMSNSKHVLQQFLDERTTTYSLRSRNHSKVLVNKTSYLNDSDFLIRLLYKYSY